MNQYAAVLYCAYEKDNALYVGEPYDVVVVPNRRKLEKLAKDRIDVYVDQETDTFVEIYKIDPVSNFDVIVKPKI